MKSLVEFSLYLLFYGLTNLLGLTWRIEVSGWQDRNKPCVFAFWHSRIFVLYYIFQFKKICILVSHSRDGEIASRLLKLGGYKVVRGSSSKDGGYGILALMRMLERGFDGAITPDGPRGPAGVLKEGIFFLNRYTSIYGVKVDVDRFWRISTWDRMMIPKPFARVKVNIERFTGKWSLGAH